MISHPKSFSSTETADAAHVADDHIAKGVLLEDDDGYLLAVIPASQWVALHRMNTELDRDLHLASEKEVARLFRDCDPGAIPPLGEPYGVETVLDEALTSLASVYFEGGDHERLIRVSGEQFNRLMKGVRHGRFSEQA
ncbi:MAG: YbaK/EbsC family protein [Pseudomonadota bacterium]|nr:YbaK/EbsC family protein [Pseudomonadota bacterium]